MKEEINKDRFEKFGVDAIDWLKNIGCLDLRAYGAEALENIKGIKNVGLILLPKMDEKTSVAFSKIPQKNVGASVSIGDDIEPVNFNGEAGEINLADFSTPKILILNGEGIVYLNGECKFTHKLVANGSITISVKAKKCLDIVSMNGDINCADFSEIRVFNSGSVIDKKALDKLSDGTLLVLGGGQISFARDVDAKYLADRKFIYELGREYAKTRIKAKRAIKDVVNTNAIG